MRGTHRLLFFEFDDLESWSNTILGNKRSRMWWAGHVAWNGILEIHTYWWGNLLKIECIKDAGVDWRIMLKRLLNRMGLECAGFVYSSGYVKVAELHELVNESSVSMKWCISLISLVTISFLVRSLLCRVTPIVELLLLGHTYRKYYITFLYSNFLMQWPYLDRQDGDRLVRCIFPREVSDRLYTWPPTCGSTNTSLPPFPSTTKTPNTHTHTHHLPTALHLAANYRQVAPRHYA